MKKIEAIIKPFKLDEVKEALHDLGFARDLGEQDLDRRRWRPSLQPRPSLFWRGRALNDAGR
jgi:hypothetical protein